MMNRWLTKLVSVFLMVSVVSMFPAFCVRAQQTFWVFSHGLNDYGARFDYLRQSLGVNSALSSSAATYASNSTTIMQQSQAMANVVDASNARGSDSIILVGHSQGGLRARWYLQKGLGTQTAKVKGLALIGTPNYGAHAAENYGTFIDQVSIAVGAALVFTSIVGTVLINDLVSINRGLKSYLENNFVGPSLPQMKPGSIFLNALNNVSDGSCLNRSSTSTQNILWVTKELSTPSQSCGSGSNPNFGPIPSRVSVMNIVGQNNNLDAYAEVNGFPKPTVLAGVVTVIAAALWAANFFALGTLTGAAVAATIVAALLWSLQAMWNALVGSNRHDSLISEDSQELRNARGVGGQFMLTRRLDVALHFGPYGNTRMDRVELRSIGARDALAQLRQEVARKP